MNALGKTGAEKRLEEARRARAPYEPEWYMNLAYYQGEQWVAWNGESLYRPRMDGRMQITDNRILPAVQTSVAQLTKMRPGWDAVPTGMDDKAVSDAATAERLLEWAWDEYELHLIRTEALTWSRAVCAGFVKCVWDSTLRPGVQVLVGPDGNPIRHQGEVIRAGDMPEIEEMEGVSTRQVGGGDLQISVRSPFDIYPDPLATRLTDARWLIDATVRSPEYIKERYGKEVMPDAPPQVGIIEQRFAGLSLLSHQGEMTGVRVYELWEVPSPSCPEGRRVVWCDNGGILYEGPNEYGRLPYVMFPGVNVPGRFWPRSLVTDMRPVQVQRNKLLSQIAANLSRFGNPALLMDQLAQQRYHGVPGEQVIVAPGQMEPKYLVPPGVPPQFFNLLEETNTALREISGQYEISQGSVPSGVTAASAISLLAEQNNTRLGPDVEAMEQALGDLGQQALDLMVRYFTVDRVIHVTGEDGVIDVESFRGSAEYHTPTVRVEAGSTFPKSLAAKQASIRDTLNMLLQYGVPIPQAELSRALRDMQVGGLERLVQSQTVDVQQATRENTDFLRGEMPVVREFDNDEIHLAVHRDFAKGQRFLGLPPEQQSVLIIHIREHEAQQQLEQMAAMQPQPGLPPDTVPTQPSGNPLPPLSPTQTPPTQQ